MGRFDPWDPRGRKHANRDFNEFMAGKGRYVFWVLVMLGILQLGQLVWLGIWSVFG